MGKTLTIASLILLSGCSSLPMCGTPEAVGKTCSHGFWGTFADPGVDLTPQRNYVTNPITSYPVQSTQPTFGESSGERYEMILVNTPNGYVMKRCKMLNGQAAVCL